MITYLQWSQKTKIVKSDYIFDGETEFIKVLPNMTPALNGKWVISIINPSVRYALKITEEDVIPDFIDCYVYMSSSSLEKVVLKHPKVKPEKQKPWDAYMLLISELTHAIDPKAASYLYKAVGTDIDNLKEALDGLDRNCNGDTISINDVKQLYTAAVTPVYSSDVVNAFFTRDSGRWRLYNKFVSNIGERYAYYSIRKRVFTWLEEKGKYLQNKEVKNRYIDSVDAMLINYAYMLFVNSDNYHELHPIMHELDNRCNESVERRLHVNL